VPDLEEHVMAEHSTPTSDLLGTGGIAAVAAAGVNAALLGLGRASGDDFAYVKGGDLHHIHLPDVVVMSVLLFGVGLVAAAVATRIGRPSRRLLQVVAVGLVVLSCVGFPSMDASASTRLTLAVMHVVVGAAYVLALRFSVATRARAYALAV
jgi:hypothetical protein